MDVQALFERCSRLGATITPTREGTLKVRAPALLPADLRQELKQHKAEIWLQAKLSAGPQRVSDLTNEWLGNTYQLGQGRWTLATNLRWNHLMAAKMLLGVEVCENESGALCWRSPQGRTAH